MNMNTVMVEFKSISSSSVFCLFLVFYFLFLEGRLDKVYLYTIKPKAIPKLMP